MFLGFVSVDGPYIKKFTVNNSGKLIPYEHILFRLIWFHLYFVSYSFQEHKSANDRKRAISPQENPSENPGNGDGTHITERYGLKPTSRMYPDRVGLEENRHKQGGVDAKTRRHTRARHLRLAESSLQRLRKIQSDWFGGRLDRFRREVR